MPVDALHTPDDVFRSGTGRASLRHVPVTAAAAALGACACVTRGFTRVTGRFVRLEVALPAYPVHLHVVNAQAFVDTGSSGSGICLVTCCSEPDGATSNGEIRRGGRGGLVRIDHLGDLWRRTSAPHGLCTSVMTRVEDDHAVRSGDNARFERTENLKNRDWAEPTPRRRRMKEHHSGDRPLGSPFLSLADILADTE